MTKLAEIVSINGPNVDTFFADTWRCINIPAPADFIQFKRSHASQSANQIDSFLVKGLVALLF